MSIKQAYKYQMNYHLKSVAIFYCVIVLVWTVLLAVSAIVDMNSGSESSKVSITGIEMSTAVFLLVVGLCSFKENFFMALQHGISRRSLFIARLMAAAVTAAITAFADTALSAAFTGIASSVFSFRTGSVFNIFYGISGAAMYIWSFLYYLFFYLAVLVTGYFLTIMFYRLNTPGKILVGAGVPVLLLIVLPLADTFVTRGWLGRTLLAVADFLMGYTAQQPVFPVVTFAAFSVIAAAFCWLLIRRAVIKD